VWVSFTKKLFLLCLKKNNGRERKYHHQNEAKNWSETRSRHRWRWICRVALVRCLGRCAWLLFFFLLRASPSSIERYDEWKQQISETRADHFLPFLSRFKTERRLRHLHGYAISASFRLNRRAIGVNLSRARARFLFFFVLERRRRRETRLDAGLHVKSAHKKKLVEEARNLLLSFFFFLFLFLSSNHRRRHRNHRFWLHNFVLWSELTRRTNTLTL